MSQQSLLNAINILLIQKQTNILCKCTTLKSVAKVCTQLSPSTPPYRTILYGWKQKYRPKLTINTPNQPVSTQPFQYMFYTIELNTLLKQQCKIRLVQYKIQCISNILVNTYVMKMTMNSHIFKIIICRLYRYFFFKQLPINYQNTCHRNKYYHPLLKTQWVNKIKNLQIQSRKKQIIQKIYTHCQINNLYTPTLLFLHFKGIIIINQNITNFLKIIKCKFQKFVGQLLHYIQNDYTKTLHDGRVQQLTYQFAHILQIPVIARIINLTFFLSSLINSLQPILTCNYQNTGNLQKFPIFIKIHVLQIQGITCQIHVNKDYFLYDVNFRNDNKIQIFQRIADTITTKNNVVGKNDSTLSTNNLHTCTKIFFPT
eukprot:TRINITY_DN2029_c0_g2_i1.p1 TRINITY_DN2029_c0_g2~~TRINITY_DN2029_c0_g2_i1.p1  ORF type:complete len:371 (-),score=-49.29 TRINITY_DN2029_c0_g2_i1:21-1133(-)